VADVFQRFKALGKKIIYVTNNCTKSRADYAKKFRQLGLPASEDVIFTAASVTAAYLKRLEFRDKSVYCVGAEGLRDELNDVGIRAIGIGVKNVLKNSYVAIEKKEDVSVSPG
jgi:ribonucleotide monophosphatase NagD (HAD superfamily)